ncbi:MAG: YwiB family protein [Saccharofermentanales bacterium]
MSDESSAKMKNVTVRIKSEQAEYGERPTKIEQISDGRLFKSGDAWNLTYKEVQEGAMNNTFTTIMMHENGMVSMDRIGENKMIMEFVEGKKHIARMDSPNGTMDIGILTNKVKIKVNENGGRLNLSYIVFLNDEYPVQTKMTMLFSEKHL